VLVLEYAPAWASVLKDLARSAAGLRVIAAVPPAAMESEQALRALGVRTVRWEGDAAPLLDAIRPLGPALTPAPGAARPPAPVVTPAPGASRPPAPVLTPAPGASRPPAPGPARSPAPGSFFGDLGGEPVPAAPAVPAPPAPSLWPATAPGEEDAEHLLVSALAGLTAAADPALDETIEALTPLETEALQSLASVADPAPIRRLATLRYRVAFAHSTAPAPGSPVDAGGCNLLLTEIDEALPALKGVAEKLPDRAAEIEAIRNALVKQAVDLSETLHRLQPGAPAAMPVRAAAPDGRRTTGRMRIDFTPEPPVATRKRTGMWVTFALVIALGGAFHAREYWNRHTRAQQAGFPGAPAGLVGAQSSAGTPAVLLPGKKGPDKAELERFRNEQALKGNEVTDLPGGGVLVLPRPAGEAPPALTPEAR
jgi:hypothetical protein